MTTAELIVRALNAAKDTYSEDNNVFVIKRYADQIRSKYRENKRTLDFQTAAVKAEIEVVEQIQEDFIRLRPGERIQNL